MAQNWDIEYSKSDCQHSEECGCKVTLRGKSPQVQGLVLTSTARTLTEQYREIAAQMNSSVGYVGIDGKLVYRDVEVEYFRSQLLADSTITLIKPPIENRKGWSESVRLFSVHPCVEMALKRADYRYFRSKFPYLTITWTYLEQNIWVDTDRKCENLQAMAMRQLSSWHWACGKTNGRPHVVAAMANLYPKKFAKSVLSMARPKLGDRPREPLKFLNEALDNLYRLMNIDLSEKEKFKFSFKSLEGMYLGASNGVCEGSTRTLVDDLDEPIRVSNKGKKIDTFEQDLEAIIEFLRTGKEPAVYWSVPPKNENFFSFTKQWSDEEWEAFTNKLRVFNIPTGIYIHLERMCSLLRHLKERGLVIRVGHKWSHGGADTLARCLGIDLNNCWDPIIVEGDAKLYDQTVRELFVNLYFSTMMLHHDKTDPDTPLIEKVLRFLIKNMVTRITQLFGEIWGIVHGGVPSGAFNTSHMDSWIMAMYFMLFCVWQIHNAPKEEQEEVEAHFFLIVRIIVYGDDHLYNKGKGKASKYFSGTLFAEFMKKHFDVIIRDLKDGIPFCSTERDGFIVEMGATKLKHQFVRNTAKGPKQPNFLPYRESREFIIRAIHGRETRSRDQVDVLLSVVGHAYGTYAANKDAYERLFLLYSELVSSLSDKIEDVTEMMRSRLTHDDLKKMRQTGITAEEIVSGFPTWATLMEKNTVDDFYQDISKVPNFDIPISGLDDIF
jgi:hypothetical protein